MKVEIKERIEMINRGEVPEGYKKTKVGIIPEDWEESDIKSLCEIVDYRGKTPTKTEDGIFLLTAKNIKKGYIDYNTSQEFIPTSDYNEVMRRGVPKKGDVVITTEAPLGNVAQIDNESVAIAQRVIKLRGNKDRLLNEFLMYYLLSEEIQLELNREATGTTVKGIKGSRFKKMKVFYPPLLEQQKIAQILSTWDQAIELKEKLIEEKKEQKKGLMQKLLTGEVRLPGFDGEWEEVRLGDIGQTFNGLTGKTSKDFGVGKPFITYKNIFANSRVDIKDVDYVKISEDENQNTTKYGDIFFTTSSETPDEVGMSSVLLDIVEELYLNSFCFGFRLNNFEILVPEYARFLFRGDVFRRKIFKLAQGSTRFNISKAEVLKLYIILPKINEQKAIAKILTTADKEIDLLTQELEQLKLQKKGLMQLLLTGIIRVKS